MKIKQPKNLLNLSIKVLNKLDQWTDQQKLYTKKLATDSKYNIIFFNSASNFNHFLDYFVKNSQYSGSSIAKRLKTYSTRKFSLIVYDKSVERILENIVVARISTMAMYSTFAFLESKKIKYFFF